MALYPIGRKVYSRTHDAVGTISEANYGCGPGSRRTASYVVDFDGDGPAWKRFSWGCGSDDLRGADYCCDGCGGTFAGQPHVTAPDGEYPNGLRFCFPCGKAA